MKTFKTTLLTIAALLCSISASAHDFEVDGIYYNILSETDKTVEVTFRGSSSDAYSDEYSYHETIPSTVTYGGITYKVTAIGEQAFLSCKKVTGVTIPNTVTDIGWRAFYYCTKLSDVALPSSVKIIGGYAFGHCESLTTITIPENVTTIREDAFSYCTNLVKCIFNATNMTSDAGISENGQYTSTLFDDCNKLTTITIGGNVKKIPAYAFWQCNKITKITIPENVISIGNEAFGSCTSLKEVTFNAKNCTSVGSTDNPTFEGCNSLTTIKIGENVKSIPSYAFSGCTKITSITIPNSVTSIGIAAFYNCTGLKSITLPNSLTSISPNAFSLCTSLSTITIPNTVIEISSGAFSGCSALTDITIPNSVKNIGDGCFSGCKSITEINIPESISRIGGTVFRGCTSLTNVTIPNTVTSIGSGAFSGCSALTNISIPNSVVNIYNAAFKDCISLKDVNIPNTVTSLYEVFRGCTSLTDIVIPNSVTSIGYAFYGCASLTDIVIPNSVTSIGDCTFRNCTNLKSVTIPNSVTSIGWAAFADCTSLTSITIPESVKEVETSVFNSCIALTEIVCKSTTPVAISSSEFYGVSTTTATLYIPKGSKNAYASATGWSRFQNIIEFSLIPEHTITYIVDGKDFYTATIEEGAEIPAIETPRKEGHTFIEWENLPSNMPDKDITVDAKFTPNNYTVTFKVNGEIISSESLAYGTTIVAPDAPEIEDYAFVEWADLLETVPAYNVEFSAVYEQVGVTIVDGATSFDQDEDISYSKITYTRTLNNTAWNALYVPFEIPVSQLMDDYEVAYINGIHSYDDDDNGEIDRMSMEVVKVKSGTLLANHPYLIKARTEAAKQMNITVNNTTLYAAESTTLDCSSIYTKYEITGIYERMTGSELAGCYALSGGTWKTIASNSYLNPFRLYLRITSRGNSPIKVSPLAMTRINIHVKGEESSTSVEEMMMQEQLSNDEIIYDLMGRRVENPVKGHIYIVNRMKRVY